jgi:hypothetical protein
MQKVIVTASFAEPSEHNHEDEVDGRYHLSLSQKNSNIGDGAPFDSDPTLVSGLLHERKSRTG